MSSAKRNKNTTRKLAIIAASCALTGTMLLGLLHTKSGQVVADTTANPSTGFEQNITNLLSTELGGNAENVRHTHILHDNDLIAPEPNPECFGTAASPAEMEGILKAAQDLLGIQSPLFTIDTPIKEGSEIQYYLDETIFAVTWKQVVNYSTYTFSEVKIAHPSQLRRFFSEGTYNSPILHTTTEMSETVNAVTASAGDFYSYRHFGIVVNDGVVYRSDGLLLDTCYIDNNGDLLFTYAREIDGKAEVQAFVEENNIRFSLSFGPALLVNGLNIAPSYYNIGEIKENCPRAALCQMDRLHYVLVCANDEKPNYALPTIEQFADSLEALGIPTAYALDGGQTASIAFHDSLINSVSYGAQRKISDIIYFASANTEQ